MTIDQDAIQKRISKAQIRGVEYALWDYDWYMTEADELAPASWGFQWVKALRDAIRENYNHGHDLSYRHLKGNGDRLKAFTRTIARIDPSATIDFPREELERQQRATAPDYPYLPFPGLWRSAQQRLTCRKCGGAIERRERYFAATPWWETNETLPHHRSCAIEQWGKEAQDA